MGLKMKRRDFLKMVGLAIGCSAQLAGDILSFVPTLRINLPFLKGTWYENKLGSGFWRFDESKKSPIKLPDLKPPVTIDNITVCDESGKDYIGGDYCEQELIIDKDFTEWHQEFDGWDGDDPDGIPDVKDMNKSVTVFLNGKLVD